MTAAALLRVTARLQRPANAQGGFSVCAVDLGRAQAAQGCQRQTPSTAWLQGQSPKQESIFSCFVFYSFFLLTDMSRKLGLWPRRYLRNGDKWRCADGSFTVPASPKAFSVGGTFKFAIKNQCSDYRSEGLSGSEV